MRNISEIQLFFHATNSASFMPPGHIGITVDDVYKACDRFEKLGVPFVKKPNDGNFTCLDFNFVLVTRKGTTF